MNTSNLASWGIANGNDHSISEKTAARVGQDLPEELERQFSQVAGTEWPWLRDSWRLGLVDLAMIDGSAYAGMTRAQAGAFRSPGGH
jgi:hypothetical protein